MRTDQEIIDEFKEKSDRWDGTHDQFLADTVVAILEMASNLHSTFVIISENLIKIRRGHLR